MAFWGTDLGGADGGDPKRKFRFKVTIGRQENGFGFIWWAKSVDKPQVSINHVEHKFFNQTFYFPGNVSWNEINMTLVDPAGDFDQAAALNKLVNDSGYDGPPASANEKLVSISKNKAVDNLVSVTIDQIDAEGDIIEQWTLKNPSLMKIEYSGLEYGSDELTEITIAFKYDWAECTVGGTDFFKPGA